MYGITPDVTQLFRGNDLIVVVDDWRGPNPTDERAPIFFMGRSFLRRDYERLAELFELLRAGEAWNWHASARGRGSLFVSPRYHEIVATLERCRSRNYSLNVERRAFDAPHLDAQWRNIRASPVGRAWSTNDPQAKGLYVFVDRLGRRLATELDGGLTYQIVVDHLTWAGHAHPTDVVKLLGATLDGRGTVFTIMNKDASEVKSLMMALGLVDSEVWAWGRLQTRTTADGRSVRGRMLEWQETRQPEPVFSQEDIGDVLKQGDEKLAHYWDVSAGWVESGRDVHLSANSLPAPHSDQFNS